MIERKVIDDFIEVETLSNDDFLKVKETLTRIGISSKKENKLIQTCHVLHKKNRYYIVHFKELFKLDGDSSDLSEEDKERRNTIIHLLESWNLITVKSDKSLIQNVAPLSSIKIITYKEKDKWVLVSKYTLGKNKRGKYYNE